MSVLAEASKPGIVATEVVYPAPTHQVAIEAHHIPTALVEVVRAHRTWCHMCDESGL